MLRPRPCAWFELVAPRADLASVLEALARSGAVELQARERPVAPLVVGGAEAGLVRFQELARRSRGHWPAPAAHETLRFDDPAATLGQRLAGIEAWQFAADPLIAELETLAQQARHLEDAARLLAAGPGLPGPDLLAAAGRFRGGLRVYVGATGMPTLPEGVLALAWPAGGETFHLLVGRPEALAAADERFAALQARRVDWPAALHGTAAEAAAQLAAHRAALDRRRADLQARLDQLAQEHDLAAALADIERVAWLLRHGSALGASERLVWVSGWTTAADEAALCAPLRRQGLPCVGQLAPPPAGFEPPAVLANPRWARGFEVFTRLLGPPAADEADPSQPLALLAPLLFGFMFGDVGQGLVLCAAGWALRRRLPALALLVPGGAMAALFGLLFGSVFAREDLIPALWLHPLHEPLPLLAAALALGAAILWLGLLLNALQAFWRHQTAAWLAEDAALLVAYAGALAAPWQPGALWAVALGAAWAMAGAALHARRPAAALGALGRFVEHALQLAVNTVSFARVGAFALAHAGLSVAVTGLAAAAGPVGGALVLLGGNLLILALEGLVVGIQTTRLLLFEFFVRFLQGRGREFRPLPPPEFPSLDPMRRPS